MEVQVYVETPDAIEDVRGYSDKEVEKYVEFIQKAAHLIMKFAQEGGFEHASAV